MNLTEVLGQRLRMTRGRVASSLLAAQEAHSQLFDRLNWEETRRYFTDHKPPQTGFDGMSAASLGKHWTVTKDPHVYTMSCTAFDLFCMRYLDFVPRRPGQTMLGVRAAEMSENAVKNAYSLQQIPPIFYPNMSEVGKRISGNNFARVLAVEMANNNWDRLNEVRRGNNLGPTEVGIIYNAWVTRQGTVFSPGLFIEAWPDVASSRWPAFINDTMGVEPNGTMKQKWRDVEQVLVLTHVHQDMFWHWMVSEAYRMLPLYHYLLAHPDIYIHINGGQSFIQKYSEMYGFPKNRFISWEYVRAQVVYYVQSIDRSDVPSVAMTGIIRHNLLDFAGVPLEARRSELTPLSSIKQLYLGPTNEVLEKPYDPAAPLPVVDDDKAEHIGTTQPEVVIRLLFIVRDNPSVGRIIINYAQLQDAFWTLALRYRLKALARGHNVRLQIMEHPSKAPMIDTWRAFSQADIILGPHGAGFANLYATRPGAHVIELVHARHLNILSTARLGLGYHAVLTNMTSEGTIPTAKSQNYVADIPFILNLVEYLLDVRFP